MDKYKDTWIESTRSFEMRDCWYHYKEGRNWISFKAVLYKLEWIVCYVLQDIVKRYVISCLSKNDWYS